MKTIIEKQNDEMKKLRMDIKKERDEVMAMMRMERATYFHDMKAIWRDYQERGRRDASVSAAMVAFLECEMQKAKVAAAEAQAGGDKQA